MASCECEKVQQSTHSPGLVSDNEGIIYCLIDPDLIDSDTGELKPKAFSKSVLKKCELSVVRQPHSSETEVREKVVAPQLSKSLDRRYCGVFLCLASEIRGIRDFTEQDVCVVDFGLPDFNAHAHLGFSHDVASQTRSVQQAVRMNLIEAFRRGGLIESLDSLL